MTIKIAETPLTIPPVDLVATADAPLASLPVETAIHRLGVDPTHGLDAAEAARRLQETGPNELSEREGRTAMAVLLSQLANPLLIILMIGGAISAYSGHVVDAAAIVVIVAINAAIGFVQETRAEASLAALRNMAAPVALVRRDGDWKRVAARELVPGDILRIAAGDILAADVRLIEANRLQIDEAALTGESEPVDKHADLIADVDAPLAERFNMGFMSTVVTAGTGLGLVAATGMSTEVGRIAGLMATAKEPRTPLQQRIDALSRALIAAAIFVVAAVIAIGLYNGLAANELLSTAISLSVAAIPEGLPTVVTIVLTLGARRMARSNALVRRLSSVETLGTTMVVCTDKTGTLTQNQMQVMRVWAGGRTWTVTGEGFDPQGAFIDASGEATDASSHPDLKHMLTISAFCNEATLLRDKERWKIQGNPTDGALVVAAAKAGIRREELLEGDFRTLQRFPFDSTRKMMSILVELADGDRYLVAKGAPDVVLRKSVGVLRDGVRVDLTPELRAEVEAAVADFGSGALRTLAIAYKKLARDSDPQDVAAHEADVVLIGIHGIMDPPRPEARDAVRECQSAGIRVVMITGDHAITARAIAEQIGIRRGPDDLVFTGSEIDAMDEARFAEAVGKAAVFARVTPEHKIRIVQALQAQGQITAMTGDGVNDAPALRRADIGVAMGVTGTPVAKDSAALVLLDDNFSSIVGAVREGRRIFENLRKFLRQGLTANVAEVTVVLLAFVLMGADAMLPLAPLMILWINLVSDGLPSLALGMEPWEEDLMRRGPRGRGDSLFAGGLGQTILIRGVALAAISYWVFQAALGRGASLDVAQTAAFVTLVCAQLWHVFDARSATTIFRKNPFSNKYLLLAVGFSFTLSMLVVYLPIGNVIFGTAPLSAGHLFQLVAIAAVPTFILASMRELTGIRWL